MAAKNTRARTKATRRDAGAESKITTDHDVIRAWVEEREGRPTIVRGTSAGESGLLRIDFKPFDSSLEEVSWEDFLAIFDANELAFLYADKTKDGALSRFSKFVSRAEAVPNKKKKKKGDGDSDEPNSGEDEVDAKEDEDDDPTENLL